MKGSPVDADEGMVLAPEQFYILIEKNGPYLVFGNPPVNQYVISENDEGEVWEYCQGMKCNPVKKAEADEEEPVALCRCGHSDHKPFCDGKHEHVRWDEKLTAPLTFSYDAAVVYEGDSIILTDNEEYCAYARFCDAYGQVWNLVRKNATAEEEQIAAREAAHCPGGRLVAWSRKPGKPLEMHIEPSIGLDEDPLVKVSGPIWVRGGIPVVTADGKKYDVRNRVALCRCGKSDNKPFCNGAHAASGFSDDLPVDTEGPCF